MDVIFKFFLKIIIIFLLLYYITVVEAVITTIPCNNSTSSQPKLHLLSFNSDPSSCDHTGDWRGRAVPRILITTGGINENQS